ncbi:MAG: aquaporin [Alphaproteobacteria bacterium]|nr:aquaporin [Alphaproteobacteria bacterium]
MNDNIKRYFAEFFGTFCLMFCILGADLYTAPFIGYLGIAMGYGISYMLVLSAFPNCQFNPIFSLASCFMDFKKNYKDTAINLILQFLATGLAIFTCILILKGKFGYVEGTVFNSTVPTRYNPKTVLITEALFTFMLVIIYLKTVGQKNFSTILGLYFFASTLVMYPITKGSLNFFKTFWMRIYTKEDFFKPEYFVLMTIIITILCSLIHKKYIRK